MPRPSLDRARLRDPPEVIAGGIAQARKRHLCPLARVRVVGHAVDERFERTDIVGDGRGPETMIERLLPERTLSAVEHGKDVVEIEIVPGPLVERRAARIWSNARPMVFRDRFHLAVADTGFTPASA